VPAVSLESARLLGGASAEGSDLRGGRARYWVTGPGVFRVRSVIPQSGTADPGRR
jgi:hypothetical protein